MKTIHMHSRLGGVVTALALVASLVSGPAQTFVQGSDYHQNFDIGTNTANFSGSGSVASWIYWYNTPGGNLAVTNDVSLDQQGLSTSGSVIYGVPWSGIVGTNNTEDIIFGTFGNQYAYDTSVAADMTIYREISFWIRADPSTAPRQVNGTNVDYGQIDVGFWYPYSFETVGTFTVPLSASNNWVQIIAPISPYLPRLTGINGIGFNFSSYNGNNKYLLATNSIFYIDSIDIPWQEMLFPTLSYPYPPISGYNAIATTPGENGQYYREQMVTVADTGYSFVGQPSATYSWNIKSFPTGTGGNFQQHFFIINGSPGPYDQAADYNFADVFWVNVQQSDAGVAVMNFRFKTNEPGGNAMLFNTFSPTDTVNNPFGWPIEPIATLFDSNGAIGTWSVNVANSTNITITSPTGLMTNFSLTAAQAAFFADPVSLYLGGQPNNPNGAGLGVVFSSFSCSGVASPFSDNFLADTAFDANLWRQDANDINGVVLVPATAAYWLPWSLPDAGFSLEAKADLNTTGGWTVLNVPIIRDNGRDQALIDSSQLPSATQGYFQLVHFQFSQLQVLFDGQANAPGTVLGYTGSPTPISGASGTNGALANVTVNAVDSNFHIVQGITDVVNLTSSADPNTAEPLNAFLNNGSLTEQVLFYVAGNFTVMAADATNPSITAGTSASLTVNP